MKMFPSDSESDVSALSPLQARKSRTGMVGNVKTEAWVEKKK